MVPFSNASPSIDDTKKLPRAVKDSWSYIGCYSALPIAWTTNVTTSSIINNLTPKKCQQACHENGLSLAALVKGNNCHCHDNLDPLDKQLNDAQCDAVCSGDKNENCGGSDSELSVWTEKGKKLKKAKTKTKVAGSTLSACRSTRKNGKSKSTCTGGYKAAGAKTPVPGLGLVGTILAVGLLAVV